jgi:hypothetical protein
VGLLPSCRDGWARTLPVIRAALADVAFCTRVLSAALLALASTHHLSAGSNSANRV